MTRPRAGVRLSRAVTLSAVVALALGLGMPASAMALDKASSWATSSNPLIETSYSSSGYGQGTWRISRTSDGTKSLSTGYLKVKAADDYDAYYSMRSQYNAGRCNSGFSLGLDIVGTGGAFGVNYSCTEAFYNYGGAAESPKVGQTVWTSAKASADVDPSANIGRARVQVCLGVPFRIDPCTGYNYTGADTY